MPDDRRLSLQIPDAPRTMQKGVPLKHLLGAEALACLGRNLRCVYPAFDAASFEREAMDGLEPLTLMARADHIAVALHAHLPAPFATAAGVLMGSLTPARTTADSFGLKEMFYLPHGSFVARFGLDSTDNMGRDPFDISMNALREITMRFTAEYAIRPFVIQQQSRVIDRLKTWVSDSNPHVRRLCSEGLRPRLPWGKRIDALVADPSVVLPILELLRNDPSLYVRRSVANHLGDIAKDHPQVVFAICESWLDGASKELRWIVRHALRYPAKQQCPEALRLRCLAK